MMEAGSTSITDEREWLHLMHPTAIYFILPDDSSTDSFQRTHFLTTIMQQKTLSEM
jgi:hypothetical protein